MRLSIIILTVVLVSCSSQNEFFEGIITYEIKAKSNIDQLNDSYAYSLYGSKMNYYINSIGDYKLDYLDSLNNKIRTLIFRKQDSKIYMIYPNIDTISYWNTNRVTDTLVNIKRDEQHEQILGHECSSFEFIIQSKKYSYVNESHRYYFSKKFKINSENYIWHKSSRWDLVTKQEPYIYLKKVIRSILHIEMEAISFERKELHDDVFMYDNSKPLKQMEDL